MPLSRTWRGSQDDELLQEPLPPLVRWCYEYLLVSATMLGQLLVVVVFDSSCCRAQPVWLLNATSQFINPACFEMPNIGRHFSSMRVMHVKLLASIAS